MCKSMVSLFIALLLISASTQAVDWRVEFSSSYFDGPNEYINTGPVTVEVYLNNSDRVFTAWSTPFKFTGNLTLDGPGNHIVSEAFVDLWDMGTFQAEESWDGDLSIPDQWNFSANGMTGFESGYGEILAFIFQFNIVSQTSDCMVTQGTLCIDSGDFANDANDWLFEPQMPFGGPYCIDVKEDCCKGASAVIELNCPDQEFEGHVTRKIEWDFSDEPNPPLLLDGPGNIDPETGVWSFWPFETHFGQNSATVYYDDGGSGCNSENYCVFYFYIHDNIFGDTNGSGGVNILDVTFLIAHVYNDGPAPDPFHFGDLNYDNAINILDIIIMIEYIYEIGP